MKNIFFIFHQRAVYAVDWKSLVQTNNHEDVFVMVTTDECKSQLSAADMANFQHIILVPDFQFTSLVEPMKSMLMSQYQHGDSVRIAVLSEFTMTVAADIRDHFRPEYNMDGPGRATIDFFRNKIMMKQLLKDKDVRVPKYKLFFPAEYTKNPARYIRRLSKYLNFPMFAKPIDSAGSIGTQFIADAKALEKWCDQAAKDTITQYEVDEYIEGVLYHCDSIIKDGKPVHTFCNRYLHPNADARVGKGLGSMTLSNEDEDYQPLMDFASHTLKQFSVIPDGFTHMEIFKNGSGELIFLEIAARAPGAKAPEVFKIRTGLDMRWLHLRLNLGLSVDAELTHLADRSNWGPYAAMLQVVAPLEGGVITKITQPTLDNSEQEFNCTHSVGAVIKPNYSILDTMCSSLMWNKNYEQLKRDFLRLEHQRVVFTSPVTSQQDTGYMARFFWKPLVKIQSHCADALDVVVEVMRDHATTVVKECPTYFPPNNPNYWRNDGGTATIFNKGTCSHKNQQLAAPAKPARLR